MHKTLSPIFLCSIYILFSLSLLFFQSSINFQFGYGLAIFLLAYCFFILGSMLAFFSLKNRGLESVELYDSISGRRFVLISLYVNVFIVLYLLFNFLSIVVAADSLLSYRQSLFQDNELKIYYGVLSPYLFIYATLIPVLGISFGLYEKILTGKSGILILSLILLIAKETILISRYYLVPTFLVVFLILYCYDERVSIKKISSIFVLFLIVMISIFSLRADGELLDNLYNARNYLISGYALFSNLIDNNGLDKFYNLSSPLVFLGVIGSKFYDYNGFFSEVQEFVYLGDAGDFNAFYTSFMPIYIYVGPVGLSFFMLVMGFLMSYSHMALKIRFDFLIFNLMFSLLIFFFSHQYLPVQLSYFWDYFIFSIGLFCLNKLFFA